MVGSRPSNETARRMGLVPYGGEGSNPGGSGYVQNNGSVANYNDNNVNRPTGYPDVNNGGYSKQGNAVPPENVKTTGNSSNQQLWSSGSGTRQGAAPTWPSNDNGVPLNPSNSWQSRQTSSSGGPTGPSAYVQPPQNVNHAGSNGFAQGPQNFAGNNGPQRTISDGIPVNNNNWQNQGPAGPAGPAQNYQSREGAPPPNWQAPNGQVTQGPQQRFNVPKGDYVYYDGNGNQINPSSGPGPNGQVGNPNEKHFHHHYYSNSNTHHHQQPYPYEVKRKQRSPAAAAIVGAIATCWVCTWCCHPCC